jgi:nucleoside-diphosphate-sugar epimerase
MMEAPSTVLVTGARGFIGRALTPALNAAGWSLTTGGPRPALDTDWTDCLPAGGSVIHLAAMAHEHAAGAELAALRPVNVAGTAALARQAAAAGVAHFVFLSSIGVVGSSSAAPLAETDPPAPATPYAQSKHEAEAELQALADTSDMVVTIIRAPLIYGPDAPGNLGRLLSWARTGRPLPLGAVTGNRRHLLGRANLVDCIAHLLRHREAADGIFHIADDRAVSTRELLTLLAAGAGRSPRLLSVPPGLLWAGARLLGRRGLAEQLLGSLTVDTARARERLGWVPPYPVEAGLREAARQSRADGASA